MTSLCPGCHAATATGDAFCSKCGVRLARRASRNQRAAALSADTTAPLPRIERTSAPTASRPRQPARPWFRRKRIVVPFVLLALMIVVASAGMLYFTMRLSGLNALSTPPPVISGDTLGGDGQVSIDTSAAQDAVTGDLNSGLLPVPKGSTTFLLMGVDARPGEAIDSGVRPDTLAVLYLDGQTDTCRMLSIPRDTRTELPGYGQSKVNHALAVGGVHYQIVVVQQLLGLEINHYGLIDFSGVEELVNAVGGVTVENSEAFMLDDVWFDAGTLELDGPRALLYARYRGGADGDFGRIGRQQEIVRALLNQTSGMDVVLAANRILPAVESHARTDLDPTDMIRMANSYRASCTSSSLSTSTLEGAVEMHPDPLINMDLSYVAVDAGEIERKVEWLMTGD